MNCPTCAIPLLITERSGIEIDYCQKCRGVWLDRGELDKLIERVGAGTGGSQRMSRDGDDEDESYERPRQGGGMMGGNPMGGGHRRERENPIGELFDFF